VASGTISLLRDGLHHPEESSYLVHFLLGLFTALGLLLVHCLLMTYFLGTGRWVKEVCLAYGLPDDRWPRQTRDIKRDHTPKAILAMLISIAAAAAGMGRQFEVWPWWVHLTLVGLTLVVNAWVFTVQYRNLRLNHRIIEEVWRETERIRAERGLPSSADELRQSGAV
jgi:hypothetical protein